jgi:hypothetical protein
MADAWHRGKREASTRSPLQGRDPRGGEPDAGNRGDRRDRRLRVGVGHPSGDPGRHRTFEVRAAYHAAAGGWVARVREENLNEQLAGRGADLPDGGREQAFPTPAACLGDAVAGVVEQVEREAAGRT